MAITMDEPRPTQAEALRAEHGDEWDIWRELLPGGGHGNWIAERLDGTRRLTAATVEDLDQQLREARS